jgi:hypothetical protein
MQAYNPYACIFKNTIMKKIDMQLVIEYAIIFAVLVVLAAIKVFAANG